MYIKNQRKTNFLSDKKASAIEFLMLACIFCGAMNFINRYFFCIYIGLIIFLIVPGRKLSVDSSFVILMLFSSAMLIFDKESFVNFMSPLKPFIFPLCYIWGRSYVSREATLEEHEKKLDSIIWVLAAGCGLHFLLNYLTNLNADSRNTIDFWTNLVMSATGQASIVCITLGAAVAYFFSNVPAWKKFFAIASVIIVFLYNLILSGRTVFVLALVVCVVAYVYRLVSEKKGNLKTLFWALLVCVAVWWIFDNNVFGVQSLFEDSLLFDRFFGEQAHIDLSEDSRGKAKLFYLRHMLEWPFGGYHLHKAYDGFAHDLYFDTHDMGGIFAFMGIVIYSATTVFRLLHFIKIKEVSFNVRQVVICVYAILHMQFWIEPIMMGMPWLLASFCLIDGFVAGYIEKYENETTTQSKLVRNKRNKKYRVIGYGYKSKNV